jgi:hypothetical protein
MTRAWADFQAKRWERLAQQARLGTAAERVAENILEDLFTMVLDWRLSEVNNQAGAAGLALTRLGAEQLIVEVRRPGALAWNERAVDVALAQAHRDAGRQRVKAIAISDGIMLYARDIIPGGHRDRLFTRLDEPWAAEDLWWLSVDGIYRPREDAAGASLHLLPAPRRATASTCDNPVAAGSRGPGGWQA